MRSGLSLIKTMAGLAAVALALTACGGAADDAPADDAAAEDAPAEEGDAADDASDDGGCEGELDTVEFAPTAPLPVYWPYFYIADPLGFYEDECIDIEFINAQAAVQQALLSGNLDIAGTGLDWVVMAPTLEDKPQWYMNVDRYLWVMLTTADSELETVADLEGGRIGINAPHDSLDADFMMGAVGLAPGDYELIPVGEDLQAMVALERGEIDAFVTAGPVSKVGIDDFSDTETKILSSPELESYFNLGPMFREGEEDLAIRFGRAVAKGMIWTWENPEASAELLMEMAPDSAEDVDQATRMIQAGNELHRPSYEARGEMDLEVYQRMVDLHEELGLIEESYDASTLFTNDLLDDIWDFDVDAEIERARNDER